MYIYINIYMYIYIIIYMYVYIIKLYDIILKSGNTQQTVPLNT